MGAPYVLHMITPLANVSPFDVNMAVDAGIDTVVPYTGIETAQVEALTQDAMFSRDPKNAARTGLFIGGRDAATALDMLEVARKAMFPPFQISVFADPSGAFTTAAAMVAVVERALRRSGQDGLAGLDVQVYGATGVVGGIAGLIAAQAGGSVTLVSHRGVSAVQGKAEEFGRRYGVTLSCADTSAGGKAALMERAEVVLACGKAGVTVLTADDLRAARRLRVAADINAVPPAGVEGVGVKDDGAPLSAQPNAVGIGALAIGNVKFKVQHHLLERMQTGGTAVAFDFQDAMDAARTIVGKAQ
ncbi:methylene-tetrahydromethanopterin dehydrogenase [Azospirillum lipoferum]|uniref:Methylenetetrahydromethanopterin dehydrogenase n=1 Tax=Azospirillum lipoferum TaxID=193 RepID=A0A5A9G698_AZOLI|nr:MULTISPECIES: NAD(P)-dependent methylenetetrahydromethanopterin dehydrogenase [Azospirillum]KAA0589122.1 methylenetetrahydromethanopterin dehydrogenase [Azospirillum lipoferum]MCP1613433.1 methylene-tetrahydromethanopterin dehydrogenase [Azospirillum lipoferum]MDW5533131.1 NAD(P)-dependent methylenetetrahydromethanopterin dehydrogenase [Azospirillum sp. NL1]